MGTTPGLVATVLLTVCQPAVGMAQLRPAGPGAATTLPRVFLDCQGGVPCDRNHFRTEITFVNWALDREDADVHVIATSEDVGGGGEQIILDFLGRGTMSALTDRLTYTARGSDVQAETRDGLTQVLRLGLMRYAVESGLAPSFDLEFTGVDTETGEGVDDPAEARFDRWNYWTFRVGLSGDVDIRETSTSIEFDPSFSAERITEDWKLGFQAEIYAERNRRELSEGREVRDDRDEWEIETIVVRSVSNHLSMGVEFDGESSVSQNQNARVDFSPAVEYNYFPYSMANRRQLTVQYSTGVQYSDYREETIFNLSTELRPQHELNARYNAREAWGDAGVGINYSQYLHDLGLYQAEMEGDVSVRITRGLNLDFSGSTSWVNDEIHIPLSDISDEDILLGRQNLPSSYRYTARVGLSYRWGSPFTNIVNTRFGGGGGGGGGGGD
jgi:hypothetical protein